MVFLLYQCYYLLQTCTCRSLAIRSDIFQSHTKKLLAIISFSAASSNKFIKVVPSCMSKVKLFLDIFNYAAQSVAILRALIKDNLRSVYAY